MATMILKANTAIFIACYVGVSASEGKRAPAPAPNAMQEMPVADLLFILSADQAVFTDANHLMLQNLGSGAQYYGTGARAGVIRNYEFLNGTIGAQYVAADGMCCNAIGSIMVNLQQKDALVISVNDCNVACDHQLDNPTATLIGLTKDNFQVQQAVVLRLASPVPVADTYLQRVETVTFTITAIGKSAIKTSKGVANEALTDPDHLITVVQPGTTLYNAALFIDQNEASMTMPAETGMSTG